MSRVLDHDRLFRSEPGMLEQISERLVSLKRDYDMEVYLVYLVVRSSSIGERVREIGGEYHRHWLGEENDGLIFLISGSGSSNGIIGRSRPL
ncbi:MAG: hypothetical protein QNL33_06760 [Akkermansiaceae bacterium]